MKRNWYNIIYESVRLLWTQSIPGQLKSPPRYIVDAGNLNLILHIEVYSTSSVEACEFGGQ